MRVNTAIGLRVDNKAFFHESLNDEYVQQLRLHIDLQYDDLSIIENLANCDNLKSVSFISIQNIGSTSTKSLKALLLSQKLGQLVELILNNSVRGDEIINDIFKLNTNLYNLKYLNLSKNHLTDVAISTMTDEVFMPQVERIYLNDNSISDLGFSCLLSSNVFNRLKVLSLLKNPIYDYRALQYFLENNPFIYLQKLKVGPEPMQRSLHSMLGKKYPNIDFQIPHINTEPIWVDQLKDLTAEIIIYKDDRFTHRLVVNALHAYGEIWQNLYPYELEQLKKRLQAPNDNNNKHCESKKLKILFIGTSHLQTVVNRVPIKGLYCAECDKYYQNLGLIIEESDELYISNNSIDKNSMRIINVGDDVIRRDLLCPAWHTIFGGI